MKRFLIPAILLALLLGACQGGAPASTEAAPSPTALTYAATQPSGESSAPDTQPAAAGTQPPGTAGTSGGASPGCTVVSPQPTPGPTEQSLFPPVSDQDWVQGPETASITIIEYGDFQ